MSAKGGERCERFERVIKYRERSVSRRGGGELILLKGADNWDMVINHVSLYYMFRFPLFTTLVQKQAGT